MQPRCQCHWGKMRQQNGLFPWWLARFAHGNRQFTSPELRKNCHTGQVIETTHVPNQQRDRNWHLRNRSPIEPRLRGHPFRRVLTSTVSAGARATTSRPYGLRAQARVIRTLRLQNPPVKWGFCHQVKCLESLDFVIGGVSSPQCGKVGQIMVVTPDPSG
jgi:hypothetical protein